MAERLPDQPMYVDEQGGVRFRANALVRYLLDHGGIDMNRLLFVHATDDERRQFAQLIGYSISGYSELPYVTDEDYERAQRAAIATGVRAMSDATTRETGVGLIAAERQRQIEVEGWTAEHDDTHFNGELAISAVAYAWPPDILIGEARREDAAADTLVRWKPGPDRIRELVKAGALIAAEIDRLQRSGRRHG